MVNSKNLIPNTERTPEELREMGRKGGIASGKARRKKRDLQKAAKIWLEVFTELESKDKTRAKQVYKSLMKQMK
jgi:hypothetical protein